MGRPLHNVACGNCSKNIERRFTLRADGVKKWYRPKKFCSSGCATAHRNRSNAVGWFDKHGYRLVRHDGRDVPEHRLVMERRIGRKLLPDETVHHKNGHRADNADSNLELWSSRHGKGQRVEDKVLWCLQFLADYPQELRTAGYQLVDADLELHSITPGIPEVMGIA